MAKSQTQIQNDVDKQRRDLQQGSLEIKALSAQIDKNLKLAQDWFAKLDGRVETVVEIPDPYPDPETARYITEAFQLRLTKPSWTLECRWVVKEDSQSDSEWVP